MKAKKERRRQRKLSIQDTIPPEGEIDDNPEEVPPEKTSSVIDLTQLAERSTLVAEDDPKSRKKQKLHHSIGEGPTEGHQPQPVGTDESILVDGPGLSGALPLFPLLTLPDTPSKTELALQGLDRAQIEAELVDPNSTLSIDSDVDNNHSALSLKTRKRLIDLGVNELFAGISHSLVYCVLLAAKVEQFRRQSSHFCSGPNANTPASTTHTTRRGTCVSRPRLVAARPSHTCYQ